jgi:hypothetical protein
MAYVYVAIHHRDISENECSSQGCWKEFNSRVDAVQWLEQRSTKSPASPKGRALYVWDCSIAFDLSVVATFDMVLNPDPGSSTVSPSLRKAVLAYIRYKKRQLKITV